MRLSALIFLATLLTACLPSTPAPASTPTATHTVAPQSTPTALPSPEPPNRTTSDRPDDHEGFQIHFVYALPNDGEDRSLDINGQIETSALAANRWLAEQSGGSQLRYDTYNGDLDVTFLQLDYSAEVLNILGPTIVQGFDQTMRDLGFDTAHKLYIVFYDGEFILEGSSLACGQSTQPPVTWGISASIYLRGYSPEFNIFSCPEPTNSAAQAGYLELVLLHEVFHLLGAVPECAPNQEASHITDNEADLMSAQLASVALSEIELDIGRDDYFSHADLGCPDLARSVFLDPLPNFAQEPPAWRFSSQLRLRNPFLDLYQLTIE
jgi:hypothetical protein